jgi:hypothetical protein
VAGRCRSKALCGAVADHQEAAQGPDVAGTQSLQADAAEDGRLAEAPFVCGRHQNHLLDREGCVAQRTATVVPYQPVGGVAYGGLRPRATAVTVRSIGEPIGEGE